MLRAFLSSLVIVAVCVGLATADDKTGSEKTGAKAKITKIDPKAHTVAVKVKDKGGKETEKTFKLTEEVRYVDSTGKVAAVDIFRNGDDVLVIEAEGKLKELRKDKKGSDRERK